jgi:hypothetical protein
MTPAERKRLHQQVDARKRQITASSRTGYRKGEGPSQRIDAEPSSHIWRYVPSIFLAVDSYEGASL